MSENPGLGWRLSFMYCSFKNKCMGGGGELDRGGLGEGKFNTGTTLPRWLYFPTVGGTASWEFICILGREVSR